MSSTVFKNSERESEWPFFDKNGLTVSYPAMVSLLSDPLFYSALLKPLKEKYEQDVGRPIAPSTDAAAAAAAAAAIGLEDNQQQVAVLLARSGPQVYPAEKPAAGFEEVGISEINRRPSSSPSVAAKKSRGSKVLLPPLPDEEEEEEEEEDPPRPASSSGSESEAEVYTQAPSVAEKSKKRVRVAAAHAAAAISDLGSDWIGQEEEEGGPRTPPNQTGAHYQGSLKRQISQAPLAREPPGKKRTSKLKKSP